MTLKLGSSLVIILKALFESFMCVKLGSEQMVIVVMHLRQVIYRKDVTKDRDLFLCSSAQSCLFKQILSDSNYLKKI